MTERDIKGRGDRQSRAERLARELRANLARRKAQARLRLEEGAGTDDSGHGDGAPGEDRGEGDDLNAP